MAKKTMGNKAFYTIPFVWSRQLWVMTFAFFALWIGVSGWMLYEVVMAADSTTPLISLVLFNVVMLPTMLLCEGYAPQRLEVGESQIVILRRYNSVTIHRDEIKSVERLPKNALRGAIRTGGVGGLFGYYGNYYSRNIGKFSLYATTFDNLFLVRKWDGSCVVFSCAEPEVIEKIYTK